MAADRLNELSKRLDKTRREIRHTTRAVAQNHPTIERSLDMLGALYTYQLEFKTYTDSTQVMLDITIFPRFRSL